MFNLLELFLTIYYYASKFDNINDLNDWRSLLYNVEMLH